MVILSKADKESIISIAKKYKVSRVLLFGSSASVDKEGNDLAVDGIVPSDFFAFYSDLIFGLTKPVDLIDLSGTSRFHRMVAAEGISIYG